jgi:2,4-dienoyl-CoA reductase (NADPH2)
MRLALAICSTVRAGIPQDMPLWVRISGEDYVEGGWDVEQSVELCR